MKEDYPDMNTEYWTIDADGDILCFEFTFAKFDTDNYDNGNYFETYEDALYSMEKHD